MSHDTTYSTATANDVDWPALLRLAEKKRVPVSKMDEHGGLRILRSLADPKDGWDR